MFDKGYSNLHGKGGIERFDISKNCKYLVTVGTDMKVKVFDYNFRGQQACQVFQQNEPLQTSFFTNDTLNAFICVGAKSQGIYLWKFIPDTEKCGVQFFV